MVDKLTSEKIFAINECKHTAIDIGKLCDKISKMEGVDPRWAAIARTDLQKGFMSLIRSIAKPETF